MPAKSIKYSDDARRAIFQWISKVAQTVMVTMGPKWRNVIIERSYGAPTVTNDGVTVAKEIELSDKFENIWAALVKEAASKTNDQAWDGTTGTCVITYGIASEWLRYIRSWVNPFALSRGLAKAVELVTHQLFDHAKKINTDQEIQQVAALSAQDEDVWLLISQVIQEVWKDGVITVEEWKTMWLTKTIVKWMQFEQWYLSPYFVSDPSRMEAWVENPAILVTDKKISAIKDILHLLEWMAAKWKRDIIIIADDVDGEALTTLVLNKIRGMLNVIPVKAPWFGDRKKEMLRDIAAVTWATLISEEIGIKLESATVDMFWYADKVIISKDKTTIIGWQWKTQDIQDRVDQIKAQLPNTSSTYDKEKLLERLARLVWWVAVIKVWAATEMEMKNKKYKIEDALNATRAAVEEGIVAWWWTALIKIAKLLESTILDDKDEHVWLQIVLSAIQYPVKQIADNAWYKWDRVVEQVKSHLDFNHGFNAATWEFGDLVASGIIDPAKVLRVSLQNATSAAAMFLTTDAAIVDVKEDKQAPAWWGMWWWYDDMM